MKQFNIDTFIDDINEHQVEGVIDNKYFGNGWATFMPQFDNDRFINAINEQRVYKYALTEGHDYKNNRIYIIEFINEQFNYIIKLYPDNYALSNVRQLDNKVSEYYFSDENQFNTFKAILENYLESPLL